MGVSGHVISFFNDGLENANNYQWWGEHPPGPGATPCWSFPRPGWLGQVTCAFLAVPTILTKFFAIPAWTISIEVT